MKITITKIIPTKDGLALALRIESEKAPKVRFGTTVLMVNSLTYIERQALLSWIEEAASHDAGEYDTPLFEETWSMRAPDVGDWR